MGYLKAKVGEGREENVDPMDYASEIYEERN